MYVGLMVCVFGVDWVILLDNVGYLMEMVEDIMGWFGGFFEVEFIEVFNGVICNWEGRVVYFMMYGECVQDVEVDICEVYVEELFFVVVGGEKVFFEVYEGVDWNVGVMNQLYLEVVGFVVFFDCLFDGCEFDCEWEDVENWVVLMVMGKKVVLVDEE